MNTPLVNSQPFVCRPLHDLCDIYDSMFVTRVIDELHVFDFKDGYRLTAQWEEHTEGNLLRVRGRLWNDDDRPDIEIERIQVLARFRNLCGDKVNPIRESRDEIAYEMLFKL